MISSCLLTSYRMYWLRHSGVKWAPRCSVNFIFLKKGYPTHRMSYNPVTTSPYGAKQTNGLPRAYIWSGGFEWAFLIHRWLTIALYSGHMTYHLHRLYFSFTRLCKVFAPLENRATLVYIQDIVLTALKNCVVKNKEKGLSYFKRIMRLKFPKFKECTRGLRIYFCILKICKVQQNLKISLGGKLGILFSMI